MERSDVMTVKRQDGPDRLSLQLGSGLTVELDLTAVELTREQRAVYERIGREGLEISLDEALGDGCPLESRVPREDFEAIRGLKTALGSGSRARGPFIDFCLHIINV